MLRPLLLLAALSCACAPRLPLLGSAPPLAVRASCPATCRADEAAREAARGATPGGRMVLWEQVLAPGAGFDAPRNGDLDLLGVILGGEVRFSAAGEAERVLRAWHAFHAPGAGVTLRSEGGARLVLVLAAAGPIAPRLAPAPGARERRLGPLAVADLAAAPDLAWGRGAYRARIAFEAPASPRASLGLLLLAKDAPVPEHAHPREWEHVAVLEGEGDLVLAKETLVVRGGAVVAVPPAMPHAWRPAGRVPLVAIQVYAPPGPEQRFRKLAAEGR